jgi:predicted ferric reductase
LGFGSFELFGGWTMIVFECLVAISILGLVISYGTHRCAYPLLLAIPGALLIYISYHFIEADSWTIYLYLGMLALLAASTINYLKMKAHNRIETTSVITCPHCGHSKQEEMPVNACRYFYECEHCNQRLKPLEGDCCVYCSYGTVRCPPIQKGEKCCQGS